MKQSVILWIAAGIITLLVGYTQSTTSPLYPINGTIKLKDGYEASYRFDKVFHGKGDYQVLIASDKKDLSGVLEWRLNPDTSNWQTVQLKNNKGALIAFIPHQKTLSQVEYRVILNDGRKKVFLPQTINATLKFLGFVPPEISQFYFITLFAGILLAIRTGLEVFKEKPRIKMYTIFTLISFFSFTFVFSTVKKGCELGVIGGTRIASLQELFPITPVILFSAWVVALILVFNTRKSKMWAAVFSLVTVIIFLAGNF